MQKNKIMSSTNFEARHNGPRQEEMNHMLKAIGVSTLDELIDHTVPAAIRLSAGTV